MNKYLQRKLCSALNAEYCKRLLIQYFVQKGFTENFNKKVYPPIIQDLPVLVPQLADKIEIEAYVKDINPLTGEHRLGWNMFILGDKRMWLGESSHYDLNEIRSNISITTKGINAIDYSSPNRIIEFIIKQLVRSVDGTISPVNQKSKMPFTFTGDTTGYYRKRVVN